MHDLSIPDWLSVAVNIATLIAFVGSFFLWLGSRKERQAADAAAKRAEEQADKANESRVEISKQLADSNRIAAETKQVAEKHVALLESQSRHNLELDVAFTERERRSQSILTISVINHSTHLPAVVAEIGICNSEQDTSGLIIAIGSWMKELKALETISPQREFVLARQLDEVVGRYKPQEFVTCNTLYVRFEHGEIRHVTNDEVRKYVEACHALARYRAANPQNLRDDMGHRYWKDADFCFFGPDFKW